MTRASRHAVFVLAGLALAGCASAPPKPPQAERPYPCIMHPPSELTPDFSVSQHVEATAMGRTGAFDSVVQKHGNELVIVGLGPAGIRAFVLRQTGDAITFDQSFGPKLPFSERNVVIDVHRTFFKRLTTPAPPEAGAATIKGTIDDEAVEEDWRDGSLVERRFSRPGSSYHGVVRVTYGAGCTRERCAPVTTHLVNEWFDYALTITNTDFNWL
jgi:hypothetical protein